MNFVTVARHDPDAERVAGASAAPSAFAERLRDEGKLAAGGPLLDECARRIGALFIHDVGSRDDAPAFVRDEPLAAASAFGR